MFYISRNKTTEQLFPAFIPIICICILFSLPKEIACSEKTQTTMRIWKREREREREWKARSKRDTEADGVTEHPERKWEIISELLSIFQHSHRPIFCKKNGEKTHQHGVQWYEVQSTHPLSLNHGYLYSKALKSPLIVSRDQFSKISMLLLLESWGTMLSCLWRLGHP